MKHLPKLLLLLLVISALVLYQPATADIWWGHHGGYSFSDVDWTLTGNLEYNSYRTAITMGPADYPSSGTATVHFGGPAWGIDAKFDRVVPWWPPHSIRIIDGTGQVLIEVTSLPNQNGYHLMSLGVDGGEDYIASGLGLTLTFLTFMDQPDPMVYASLNNDLVLRQFPADRITIHSPLTVEMEVGEYASLDLTGFSILGEETVQSQPTTWGAVKSLYR